MSKNEVIALANEGNDQGGEDEKIQLDGIADVVLSTGAVHLWAEVRNIAVYIWQGPEGVVVDLYPNHHEVFESLASTWETYAEAREAREDVLSANTEEALEVD